jgi:hypothetical protein
MATDPGLLATLRTELRDYGTVEKPMSGGIQFVWKERMLCGVMGDDLLVRIDKRDYDGFIVEDGAHPMVMAGQTSKGWILVPKRSVAKKPALRKWLGRATDFVGTLKEK